VNVPGLGTVSSKCNQYPWLTERPTNDRGSP
jgi:hypothetical protein